jgi:hypothetical protein
METTYNKHDVYEMIRNIESVQDLIHLLHSCDSDNIAQSIPGVATALEKLLDPVAEFIDQVYSSLPDLPGE